MLSGRLLAQLAEVALRDAAAQLDPRHTPDDIEGMAPTRAITLDDVEESRRLTIIAEQAQYRAALAGFGFTDDPFESDEDSERRRCEAWDHILP